MEERVDTRYKLIAIRSDADNAQRRKKPRVQVYTVAALVSAPGLAAPLCCTVRDLSEEGARLELDRDARRPESPAELPKHVTVFFCPAETEVACRVTWQDGAHFGVEFDGEMRKAAWPPS